MKTILAIVVVLVLVYMLHKEGFLPAPYILSNGLVANTDLEMVIDADYNWNAPRRPDKGPPDMPECQPHMDINVLYDAMNIDQTYGPATEPAIYVNDVGYQYKMDDY